MGLLERIKNLSDTDISKLLRSRRPEEALGKLVFELEDSQRQLRGELAKLDRRARWLGVRIKEQQAQLDSYQQELLRATKQGNKELARLSRSRIRQLKRARLSDQQSHSQLSQLTDRLRKELDKLREVTQKVWARKTDFFKARQAGSVTGVSSTAKKDPGKTDDARKTDLLRQVADELQKLRQLARAVDAREDSPTGQ